MIIKKEGLRVRQLNPPYFPNDSCITNESWKIKNNFEEKEMVILIFN